MTPAQSQGIPASTLAIKRALFPLRAPRTLTLACWPVDVFCAAVDGYYEAFFMSLTPAAAGTVSLADACFRWETLE